MQFADLKVTGMSCGDCVGSVTVALKAVDGVDDVTVSHEEGAATVSYDEHRTSKTLLTSAVIETRYGVNEQTGSSKGGWCG